MSTQFFDVRLGIIMNKLIDLLKRCETILITAKAPKSDLETLTNLIKNLEFFENQSLGKFYNYIQKYSTVEKQSGRNKNKQIKSSKFKLEDIKNIYKKFQNKQSLTKDEKESLHIFENKYPQIRGFLFCDLADLYNKISDVGEKMWTIEVLKLLLLFHFNIKQGQNAKKSSLLSELKKNVYNKNYMGSMKEKYEGEP